MLTIFAGTQCLNGEEMICTPTWQYHWLMLLLVLRCTSDIWITTRYGWEVFVDTHLTKRRKWCRCCSSFLPQFLCCTVGTWRLSSKWLSDASASMITRKWLNDLCQWQLASDSVNASAGRFTLSVIKSRGPVLAYARRMKGCQTMKTTMWGARSSSHLMWTSPKENSQMMIKKVGYSYKQRNSTCTGKISMDL